ADAVVDLGKGVARMGQTVPDENTLRHWIETIRQEGNWEALKSILNEEFNPVYGALVGAYETKQAFASGAIRGGVRHAIGTGVAIYSTLAGAVGVAKPIAAKISSRSTGGGIATTSGGSQVRASGSGRFVQVAGQETTAASAQEAAIFKRSVKI